MSLFYRYIEKPDIVNPELKSQAFIYWGDYFASMMFVFWGSLTLLGTIIMMIFGGSISILRIVIIVIMLILIALNSREMLIGKTAQKQFEIPETQISEIHRNAAQNLLSDLRVEGFFLSDE